MGTLVALMFLLSCGAPRDASDCRMRCHGCEPSCVNTRGSPGPTPDEECAAECNIDNNMWACDVEAGECVVISG